ncbi:MAG: zinc ribbon domain-containing protein [Nocardioidaceae bacterium]
MPELAVLADLTERHRDVEHRHGKAQTDATDLAREQRKADADVEQVKTRRARNQERIDQGLVSDPKQLQAMQHEVTTLDHRVGELEDVELEVMERLESTQTELTSLAAELSELDDSIGEQEAARDSASAELTEKRSEAKAERQRLVAEIPENLLTQYDKLRAQFDGVAVGALHQKRCGGCRLDIGAAELARIADAPSDEVVRCEECNRILVRTDESGV